MNKLYIYILIIILSCTGVYLNFKQFHEEIPSGCDEFGYMNLAKAIDEHKTYESHTSRPYLDGLLDTLRKESCTEFEIDYMVAPMSYYVIPGSNKIINMYPPATSFILSLFPIENRKAIFPLLVIFLFLLIPLLVVRKNNSEINWFDFSLFVFLLVMIKVYPLKTELMRINSLGLSFGLLLAAGISLKNRPLLSCALIALSSNFRLVNLLMIFPLIAFVHFPKLFSKDSLRELINLIFKYSTVILFCLLPYFIYSNDLLGNPISSTYSSVDTAMNKSGFTNFIFYFNFEQKYFIFHLLIVSILIWFILTKRISFAFFIKLLLFPLLNYFYLSYKSIVMNYYPYASCFILLGFCFNEFSNFSISEKQKRIITIVCISISFVVLFGGIYEYNRKEHISYDQANDKYKNLCRYDIVWGDEFPGASEYVCNNSGFMFYRTTSNARNIAIHYLNKNGYSQAILLNDHLINKSEVLKEMETAKFKYHIVNDSFMGEILVLE